MSFRTWWKARKERRRIKGAAEETTRESPLREFVYLDAVSLQSLLVSQNMTLLESVSQGFSTSNEAEASSSFSGDALVGKGEITARYQASNSNNLESSRKAVVQSLFKEFRELPLEFKLVKRNESPSPFEDAASIPDLDGVTTVEPAARLKRGDLVEIEVQLAVDPVFKLAAMMTEWSAMADEYPQMFGTDSGILSFLRGSEPIMKVLERFLAGLIPIRATAVNHVVVEVSGNEYVVDKRAVEDLDIQKRPLQVVGVTEQQSYWRDIRLVLFSDATFKVLGRIARDGIQQKWTPVKLADLFSDVAPDFADTINAIRSPSAADLNSPLPRNQQESAPAAALRYYKEELLTKVDLNAPLPPDIDSLLENLLPLGAGTVRASEQRRAFDQVRDLIFADVPESPITAEEDLAARQRARQKAGLELFPSTAAGLSPVPAQAVTAQPDLDGRLIDMEVIAIYW
jgi:hypothetical protein